MKSEPRTEVVSVRLTKAEKALLNSKGGASAVLRRALQPARPTRSYRTPLTMVYGSASIVWEDGTVGPNWPPILSGV